MYHLSMWKYQARTVPNFCHLAAIFFYANKVKNSKFSSETRFTKFKMPQLLVC